MARFGIWILGHRSFGESVPTAFETHRANRDRAIRERQHSAEWFAAGLTDEHQSEGSHCNLPPKAGGVRYVKLEIDHLPGHFAHVATSMPCALNTLMQSMRYSVGSLTASSREVLR